MLIKKLSEACNDIAFELEGPVGDSDPLIFNVEPLIRE